MTLLCVGNGTGKKCFSICLKWMSAILKALDAEEWTYRGEGAVNLVLAYCGSSPHFVQFCFSYFHFTAVLDLLKLIVKS